MKACGKCGEKKPEEDFGKSRRAVDGRQIYCLQCTRAIHRSRRMKLLTKNRSNPPEPPDSVRCNICHQHRPSSEFQRDLCKPNGLESRCRHCLSKYQMLISAKMRARKRGLPFTLRFVDILKIWPKDDCCPITCRPFVRSTKGEGPGKDSPSLDRIVPEMGYVTGNVAVISTAANLMKQDECDPQTFRRLADWIETVAPTARLIAQIFN